MTGAHSARHGHSAGGSTSPTYSSWIAMKTRCTNPKAGNWNLYGARGIGIWPAWVKSFETFLADMGERPEGKTLDRIDTDGNYEPGNCRWSTPVEQQRNRRSYRKRRRTHCLKGHPFSPENVRCRQDGRWRCAECCRIRDAAKYAAHHDEINAHRRAVSAARRAAS